MQFQIILSGKNKKYNKLSAVELAMGKLIQLYLVGVGEFLVCMQFSAKKKKKKKIRLWSDAVFCVICWISPEVVKVKFGQIQIHLLNEVFVGEFFTIVRLPIYMQLYAKQNQYYALYLDISCLISSPVETICRTNQSFFYWETRTHQYRWVRVVNLWKMFRCVPPYFYVRVTELIKLRRKVTLPMKNIYIKS